MTDRQIRREAVTVGCQAMPAYGLTGSPAQAVLYGVLALAPHLYGRKPDLVISGINYGENLGTCVTASGTVGAALQAAELGVPGLAVSLETDKAFHLHHGQDMDWSAAAAITRHFAQTMLAARLPFDVDVLKDRRASGRHPGNALADRPNSRGNHTIVIMRRRSSRRKATWRCWTMGYMFSGTHLSRSPISTRSPWIA